MRVLEQHRIAYVPYFFDATGETTGVEVAAIVGKDPARVFKTLVTVAKSGAHYVFVIPVAATLDLKKAAAAVGEKNVAMIPQKELLPLTGYVHGGCSPVGMKKPFVTTFDASASTQETILFSAGKIGAQVEIALTDLSPAVPYRLADLCMEGDTP